MAGVSGQGRPEGPGRPAVRRRWPVALFGAVLLVVLSATVAAALRGGDDPGRPAGASEAPGSGSPSFPAASPVATVAPVAPFTTVDANRISKALGNPDPETTALVVAPTLRDDFLQSGAQAVPPGSTVTVLTDRFTAVRPDYASVPFIVAGPRSGNFVAVLVYEEDQWFVVTTQEVE